MVINQQLHIFQLIQIINISEYFDKIYVFHARHVFYFFNDVLLLKQISVVEYRAMIFCPSFYTYKHHFEMTKTFVYFNNAFAPNRET